MAKGITRSMLAHVFTDPRTLREFESISEDVNTNIPESVAVVASDVADAIASAAISQAAALAAQSAAIDAAADSSVAVAAVAALPLNASNVTLTTPVSGDLLSYTGSEWVNAQPEKFKALVSTESASYTEALLAGFVVTLCDATSGAIIATLPACATCSGLVLTVKKVDVSVNTVTLTPNGVETIDGSATKVISSQYQSIRIVSDGATWHVIG